LSNLGHCVVNIYILKINYIKYMANISDLGVVISDLFGVIGIIINEIVNLITGDLLVLAIVGAFITFIIGIIVLLLNFMKGTIGGSVKMKK